MLQLTTLKKSLAQRQLQRDCTKKNLASFGRPWRHPNTSSIASNAGCAHLQQGVPCCLSTETTAERQAPKAATCTLP